MHRLGLPSPVLPEVARTVCILRRMHRKALSRWGWSHYTPFKAQPQELEFGLLDDAERQTGSITYTQYKMTKGELNTPWGRARIAYGKSWTSGPIVTLNDREYVRMKVHPLKKTVELTFRNGTVMVFSASKGWKNDLEYIDDKGFVGIYEEKGQVPDGPPTEPRLTKDEIKMLPKDQRPRSIEAKEYTQFRLKTSGSLPIALEEVKVSLMILTSWVILMDEVPM